MHNERVTPILDVSNFKPGNLFQTRTVEQRKQWKPIASLNAYSTLCANRRGTKQLFKLVDAELFP